MKKDRVKAELQLLYKKDKNLAKKVASVLGFKIEAKKVDPKKDSKKGKKEGTTKKVKAVDEKGKAVDEKVKAELKDLYKKDQDLAKEVASALGYKIKALKMQNAGPDAPKGATIPKVKEGTAKKITVPNQIVAPKVKMGKRSGKTRK